MATTTVKNDNAGLFEIIGLAAATESVELRERYMADGVVIVRNAFDEM